MKNLKKEPWRIIVGILSAAYIVFMWVKNDIVEIYSTMPQERILPMIITTIIVSAVKVAAIAAGILLIKKLLQKLGGQK